MKQVKLLAITFLLITVASGAGASTDSVEVAGFEFAGAHQTPQNELPLRGQGLLRYMVFIKAYAGVLYLPADIHPDQVLDPVPRRLELAYFHAISAEDFARATREKMADNVTPEQMASLSARLERFNALYRDIQPGDRYALTYLPGEGTELSLNGQRLGVIAGDDFAAAVFAIWLGPEPIDRAFKKSLLGVT